MPCEAEGLPVGAAVAAEGTVRVCAGQSPGHGIQKCTSAVPLGRAASPRSACLLDIFEMYDMIECQISAPSIGHWR